MGNLGVKNLVPNGQLIRPQGSLSYCFFFFGGYQIDPDLQDEDEALGDLGPVAVKQLRSRCKRLNLAQSAHL